MNELSDNGSEPVRCTAFHSLDPQLILTLVESALGCHCTNICRPMNSYINRVYELQDEDGQGLIAKFYRPGRWSRDGLQDEHDFLLELQEQEVPVIAPMQLQDNATLGSHGNMHFAVFPKKGGRSFDEYSDDQWQELGHLLGRTHRVGAGHRPKDRIIMSPDKSTRSQVDYIVQGNFMAEDQAAAFQAVTAALIDEISPLFENVELIRIHGDCHSANFIYRPGESFYLIDLDDMAVGPPVQDFWMLLPGTPEDCLAEIDIFLEGYETFRDFDRSSMRLIEPLRAMRYIHYIAWCAHQVTEDGASLVMPNFGTREYWQTEIGDLEDQLDRIRTMPRSLGNII